MLTKPCHLVSLGAPQSASETAFPLPAFSLELLYTVHTALSPEVQARKSQAPSPAYSPCVPCRPGAFPCRSVPTPWSPCCFWTGPRAGCLVFQIVPLQQGLGSSCPRCLQGSSSKNMIRGLMAQVSSNVTISARLCHGVDPLEPGPAPLPSPTSSPSLAVPGTHHCLSLSLRCITSSGKGGARLCVVLRPPDTDT